MKTITQKTKISALPVTVFDTLDDLGVTGMHMTKSSPMMMGSKLKLEFLTDHHKGSGSKYRWTGSLLGMELVFTVKVTKWIKGVEKTWETIGEAKMILFSWYRMKLLLKEVGDGSEAELSITYEKPKGWFGKILSFFFAGWYCNWCIKNMLRDANRTLKSTPAGKPQ